MIRLSAVLRRLLLFTLVMLACSSAQAAGIPTLFGSSESSAQPQADQPLDRSLDEVIQSLENDKQRAQLLNDLKPCATPPRKPSPRAAMACWG